MSQENNLKILNWNKLINYTSHKVNYTDHMKRKVFFLGVDYISQKSFPSEDSSIGKVNLLFLQLILRHFWVTGNTKLLVQISELELIN